ncbi:MAG: TetR/AcrR family transcriptional regulator, partial [Myxococcales bacterium]|nr:TetR/AcrR family transcriptional regulator [Myxococcales bacterium]
GPISGERPAGLRRVILDEATRLFADRGYGATSVRQVVEASGCTKPALYYYFDNKRALYLEAIREETDHITGLLSQELAEAIRSGTIRARLELGLRAFLAHVERNPRGMRLLLRAELRPEPGAPEVDFESVHDAHTAMIAELLRLGRSVGEIRADVDIEEAAYAICGMIDHRLQRWLHGRPLPATLTQSVLDIFLRGVAT